MTLTDRRNAILSEPIHWLDSAGVVHAATGDYLTPTDFCLWTVCELYDVPANTGYRPRGDAVSCPHCIAKLGQETPDYGTTMHNLR